MSDISPPLTLRLRPSRLGKPQPDSSDQTAAQLMLHWSQLCNRSIVQLVSDMERGLARVITSADVTVITLHVPAITYKGVDREEELL